MSTVRAGARLLGLAVRGEGARGAQPPPASLATLSKTALLGVLVTAMVRCSSWSARWPCSAPTS